MGIPLNMRIGYDLIMLDIDKNLPKDPDELRQFTALLLAEVRSQAVLIEKLRHQLAGQPLPGRRLRRAESTPLA